MSAVWAFFRREKRRHKTCNLQQLKMRGGSRTKNFHLSFAIRLLNKSLSTDSGVKTTKATLLEAVKQRF